MTYYSGYNSYYGGYKSHYGSYGSSYGCSYQKKYEWSAFTESDLLKDGDTNLGCGDTFTMPAGASVCMSTYDDDSKLSGDEKYNENATDHSGQQAYVDGAKVGSQMYAESYHVLKGSDGKTYYLIEIEVEGHDAPGVGDDYFTFYGAVPPAGVELSVVQTCNVSGCWVDFSCLGAGDCAPANTPPTFTNIPADGILCVDENTTFVIDLNADDADGDSLSYEIVGGADAASFEIDPATGELTFKGAPDYEAPGSADGDNLYDVTVKVSDGKGGEDITSLKVNVCDVDEGGNGSCIVIEAEDMKLCGFTVQDKADASGDALIKGRVGCWSSAKTTFEGADGEYDLTLTVLDENDGQGWIYIYVNGKDVSGPIKLDLDNGGNGWDAATYRDIVIEDLQLKEGDVITIWGKGQGCEAARIDKIKLCQDGDPMTGALGDTVWFDADKDGIQDADEAGVAGITVNLKDADGNVIATTETDANGNYLFENLAAGDYSVAVVPAGGLAFTTQDVGDDAADSDVDAATGMTGTITLGEGETNLSVDAGLIDPGTASLAGRYFCDENDNDVDDNEPGIANARVVLTTAAGVFVAETFTDADGNYIFTGLDAGDYKVTFDESAAGGKVFIAQDVGSDDTVDSDVDPDTGMTGVITLAIGDAVTDVDAGVEQPNTDPDAQDDAGHICANELLMIDVLANDSDADGDALSVTAVNGIAISDGATIDVDGVFVTLTGGKLSFDAEAALVDLDLGEQQTITYSYTVEDGNGGSDVADIAATFCGVAETVEEICASLPATTDYQILSSISLDGSIADFAFDIMLSGSGDARLDGLVIEEAYCLSFADPADVGRDSLITAPLLSADLYCADDMLPAGIFNADQIGVNGEAAADNMDLINYILNQDYTEAGFTGWEVQFAVWALTDDFDFETTMSNVPSFGDADNVQDIIDTAILNGEGFEVGAGDIMGLVLDPNPVTDANAQPFILAVEFDSLDCLC